MTLKQFKIKVESKSHSREIQEWLFSLGYSWWNPFKESRQEVKYLKEKYLYFSKTFIDHEPTLAVTSDSDFFDSIDLPEAWFYDGQIQYEPKPQPLIEFKIKVESPEHSRKIQEFVFSMRYIWWTVFTAPNPEVKHLDEKYLYFTKSEIKNKIILSATSNSRTFNSLNIPEMWFYDGKLHDKPQTSLPKEEVSMSNIKTYREVAEALLKGIELQSLDSERWIPITYLGVDVRYLDNQYPRKVRVKPRTCNGVELDPCLEPEQLKKGIYYYYPDPMHVDYYGSKLWNDDGDDHYWFELGFAYTTPESAAKHGQAMGLYK